MKPRFLASALFAATLAAPLAVQAEAPATGQPTAYLQMDTSNWDRTPTAAEFTALYPNAAMGKHLRVETEMTCTVQNDGSLSGCALVKEDPKGGGFGRATLLSARYFRMKTGLPNGAYTAGSQVRIPLIWTSS